MPIIDTFSPLQSAADSAAGYLNAKRQAKSDQSAIDYQQGQDKQKQQNWQDEFGERKRVDDSEINERGANTDKIRQDIKIAAATEEYNKQMRVWNLKNAALEFAYNKGKLTEQQLDNEKKKLDVSHAKFVDYLEHKYGEREAQQAIEKGDADIASTRATTAETQARTSQIGVETQNEREGLGRGGTGTGTLSNVPPGWTKGQVAKYNLAVKQYAGQREYWSQLHPGGGPYMGQGDDPMPNPPAPPKMDDFGPNPGKKNGTSGDNTNGKDATGGDSISINGANVPTKEAVQRFHSADNATRLKVLVLLQRGQYPGMSPQDQSKYLAAIKSPQAKPGPYQLQKDPAIQGAQALGQGIGTAGAGQQF